MTTMAQNRRRYFRIDDRMRLSCKPAQDLKNIVTYNSDAVDLPARELLQALDGELNTLLNSLWQQQPVAAEAIGLLNRKLAIISAAIDLNPSTADELNSREIDVNISGCGMAFNSAESFADGQLLELQLTLLPSETVLRMLARVIESEPVADDPHHSCRLRVEFAGRESEAQEQLIRHLVQRQSAQLAADKADSDAAG
ncbi:MAG: PilZ domain-containing protein [Halieaceae bacterium]